MLDAILAINALEDACNRNSYHPRIRSKSTLTLVQSKRRRRVICAASQRSLFSVDVMIASAIFEGLIS